jgi:hypothetical protein
MGILQPLVLDRRRIGAVQGDIPEKGRLIFVDPDSVDQPVLIPAEPGQERGQIGLAAFGVADGVDLELQHVPAGRIPDPVDRLRRAVRHEGLQSAARCTGPEPAWGDRPLVEAERPLDVLRVGLDLVDQAGIELADLDPAGVGVDEEADELLAVERELGDEGMDPGIHMVIRVLPELVQDLLDACGARLDGDAVAEDEVGGEVDDPGGEGIGVIGLVAAVVQFEVGGWEDVFPVRAVGEGAPIEILLGGGAAAPSPVPFLLDRGRPGRFAQRCGAEFVAGRAEDQAVQHSHGAVPHRTWAGAAAGVPRLSSGPPAATRW